MQHPAPPFVDIPHRGIPHPTSRRYRCLIFVIASMLSYRWFKFPPHESQLLQLSSPLLECASALAKTGAPRFLVYSAMPTQVSCFYNTVLPAKSECRSHIRSDHFVPIQRPLSCFHTIFTVSNMTRIPFRHSLWDSVISPMLGILYSQLFLTLPEPNSDFSGQTCIVTGANAGLGFEVAQHMVRLNATRVILAVRSVDRGEAACKELEEATGRTGIVEVWPLDLSSFDSVKEFRRLAASKLDRLDCLVENAGIIVTSYETAEDYEATLTVNVLGTFLLAGLILPLLKKTATQYNIQPRLTIVVSELHAFANFPERSNTEILASLNANTSSSDMARQYPISKLMALHLTWELAIRVNRVDS